MKNNVIAFPKSNKRNETTQEDVLRNLEMMRHYHIQEAIAALTPMIFNQLEVAGFDVASEEEDADIRDGALIVEGLRSIMCKHYGLYHPFQEIARNVFIPDTSEIGAFRIADNLNINLKRNETD